MIFFLQFSGSPGTPAKNVSLASIAFNQEELHFTPSLDDRQTNAGDKTLALEISPANSLHTPSPQSDRDGPLITPPLGNTV